MSSHVDRLDCYPPEYDGPVYCEVCGKHVYGKTTECKCPECPGCGEIGNPKCNINKESTAVKPKPPIRKKKFNNMEVDMLDVSNAALDNNEDFLSSVSVELKVSTADALMTDLFSALAPLTNRKRPRKEYLRMIGDHVPGGLKAAKTIVGLLQSLEKEKENGTR